MKYLVFAIVIVFLGARQSEESHRIVVLFDPSTKGRPLATNRDAFWQDKEDFDTLIISNKGSVKNINQKLALLKKGNLEFSVYAAFIRYYKNGSLDTFYTDRFFIHWQKNEKILEDKSGYFKSAFAGLFPY